MFVGLPKQGETGGIFEKIPPRNEGTNICEIFLTCLSANCHGMNSDIFSHICHRCGLMFSQGGFPLSQNDTAIMRYNPNIVSAEA